MRPEISHRCPSCGASVRETDALFCHECGKPLTKEAETSIEAAAGPAPGDVREASEPKTSESPAAPSSLETESAVPAAPPETISKETGKPEASADAPHQARRGDKTRERLHRASEVARGVTRGVIEEPAKQVEKIRHVSSVMIEEASYDPSLRFVLVALGLFVIFIVLLVLSKVMG